METWQLVLLIAGLVMAGLVWLVRWFKRGAAQARAARADFEQAHGLVARPPQADQAGVTYRAEGQLDGLPLSIESDLLRTADGWRSVTLIRVQAQAPRGALVCVRRAYADLATGLDVVLAQQRLDGGAFDDTFRTLCASAAEAQALLPADLQARLLAHARHPLVGAQVVKIAQGEVAITMGSSLASGLVPIQRQALEELLQLARELARGQRGPI